MEALLPYRKIVALNETFDRTSVRYALSWRHPPGALKDLPNLRVILSLGAGVDHLFADPALPDRPIVRVVDPDLTNRMSEWVVMHALVHLRQLRRYERQQRERVWEDDDAQPKASDVQIGVLGLGVMGQDAVAKLKALGFKVAGWSASPKSLPDVACFSGADGLKRMLAQTDMLVVLLPLTEATRGIVNASLLSQLRQKRPARRPDPHQRRTWRAAGRSRHPRRAELGRAKRRIARCVRARAAATGFAPMGASCGLYQPAQCGDLLAQGDRRARRPADRGLRTRRSRSTMSSTAAAATEPRRQARVTLRYIFLQVSMVSGVQTSRPIVTGSETVLPCVRSFRR